MVKYHTFYSPLYCTLNSKYVLDSKYAFVMQVACPMSQDNTKYSVLHNCSNYIHLKVRSLLITVT